MKKIIFLLIISVLFIPLTKVHSQPAFVWGTQYSTNLQDSAVAITSNTTLGVFVTGWSMGSGSAADIVTVCYNFDNGNQVWANRFSTTMEEKPTAIVADNNFVYITGWGFRTTSLRDIITIKYNAQTGDTVFVRYYNNTNGGDYGRAIDVDNSGNVYVTGRSDVGGSGGQKFTTIKYDPSGNQVWVYVYNGSLSTTFDESLVIKVEKTGNAAYVTGYCNGSSANTSDILTIKINGSGTLAWDKRYNGNQNHEDKAIGLFIDNSGQYIFVGGYASRNPTNQDFYVVKYNASTGDSVSAMFYMGSNNIEFAYSMAKDDSDNVYLGGLVYLSGFNHFQTVRFNSSLTHIDWAKQDAGSDTTIISSIAFDSAGYIWATGYSSSTTSGRDYLTIRYKSSSGEETWRRTESSPGNFNDYSTSIVSPLKDNVCLTGSYVAGGTTGTNYYTVRYVFLRGVKPISSEVPNSYNLEQNYPNPFNPVTNIRFDISKSAFVNITIYDMLGREVAVLVNENMKPGKFVVDWDASNFSSGIYFYRIIAGDFSVTKKMVLNK